MRQERFPLAHLEIGLPGGLGVALLLVQDWQVAIDDRAQADVDFGRAHLRTRFIR